MRQVQLVGNYKNCGIHIGLGNQLPIIGDCNFYIGKLLLTLFHPFLCRIAYGIEAGPSMLQIPCICRLAMPPQPITAIFRTFLSIILPFLSDL